MYISTGVHVFVYFFLPPSLTPSKTQQHIKPGAVIDFSVSVLSGDGSKRVTSEPIWKHSALNQTTLVRNSCCLGELYCHLLMQLALANQPQGTYNGSPVFKPLLEEIHKRAEM